MGGPDSHRISVLHVDDEPGLGETTAEFLRQQSDGFSVETATSTSEGLKRLTEAPFDCIVSDYDMADMDGIEFLRAVRAEYPDLPFVLFTGKGSEEVASEAVSAGVSDYLQKRGGTERYTLLANRITNLVTQHRAEERLRTRVQQQEAVADLGQYALTGCGLDALFERAVESVAAGLNTEYSKVLEYRPADNKFLLRAGVGWQSGLVGEAAVGAGEESQAGYTLQTEEPVVVEDLRTESRFSGPSLLLDHGVVSGISVIIGTTTEPWGVLGAHTSERRPFTKDDITFVRGVANTLTNAIEREQLEGTLRQAEQRYKTLLENFPGGGVFLFDDDLRYLIARGEGLSAFGLTPADVEGKTLAEVFPPAVVERQKPKYRAALDGETQVWTQEYEGKQYRLSTLPVTGSSDKQLGMVVSMDITGLSASV
ncbi:HTR-like protein [Haloarcula marismortui ATCC 43049]|uniref:HTR-like protein n=1 Tax=Haloarcula marismortui (strain ATCC 43049 / DSM 3752 / JCM 8966 / VKM B-1809) TaxID=272569 RepID=Q5V0A8_HALMA|nr:response regulator [Haloarcula marismortui]AAV47045.1 HTR-like protein [Haloarcula marismortui ATCC 43049]QCP91745.1 response regulator [Haloarcula marismortui ATCC 43049]